MLPLCFINPGDVHLSAIPNYPVCSTYTKYFGGEVFNLPLLETNGFLPDFSIIPKSVLKRAKTLYLNYPNNPTGAIATKDFFKGVIDFASKNGMGGSIYKVKVNDDIKRKTLDGYQTEKSLYSLFKSAIEKAYTKDKGIKNFIIEITANQVRRLPEDVGLVPT